MILSLVKYAHHAGARLFKACELVGISDRNLRRWNKVNGEEDGRQGPLTPPANKLSHAEVW